MPPASRWVAWAIAAGLAVPLAAQRFETGATAVVVDVVVRDKGGRFVTGLTPADFTVAEDGIPQPITSLALVGTPVEGRSTGPAGTVPSPAPGDQDGVAAPEQPRFTALVFDRLEAANADIVRAGARAAIATAGRTDVTGVFLIDHGLRMLQPFTTDKANLTAGVERAVAKAISLVVRDPDTGRRNDAGDTPTPVPSVEFRGGFDASGAPLVAFGKTWEMLDRQFQGGETTDALLTATAALSILPGRKTLLYFSDAIVLPSSVLPKFDDVIATANRGQVTIYAIDTGGLRVGSQQAATAGEIVSYGKASMEINTDGSSGASSLSRLERNEETLRRSPGVGMAMLSKPTGGFLIENTNDLAAGVRRIDEDRRVHYLLTYAPVRTELDGRWRAIDVTVRRPGTMVQARQGYVAVRSPGVLPVLVYEGPALAALDRTPAPRAIATRVGAFAFPRLDASAIQDVAVIVAAPADTLTFDVKGPAYRTDFTMLALVRNADGEPTHKTSQPYRLTGLAPDRAAARAGEVRLSRTLPMEPGSYEAWGSVHDAASGRAGIARWPLRVEPRGDTGLGVSSLVLLSRIERAAPGPASPADPLVIDGRLITPNLGEPMFQTPDARLGFYFVITGADSGEQIQARLQFYRDGIPEPKPLLLEAPIPIARADARGVVRPLGSLPLKDLPIASLEARLTVERFGQQDVRRAFFRLDAPHPVLTGPPSRR